MTKKHRPENDGPQQSLAIAFTAAQEIILVLQRGLAEVLAASAEKTWPLIMRDATAEQHAKFRELLLKTVRGRRLTDEELLAQVSAAARKALAKPRSSRKK